MGNLSVIENIIRDKLNNVHTAYLGKVISFNGTTATIQPLQRDTSIIPNVPVIHSARYKLKEEIVTIQHEDFYKVIKNLVKVPLKAGDIVVCVCCEKNISTALKGKFPSSSEPTQNHSLSNSIIVGIL